MSSITGWEISNSSHDVDASCDWESYPIVTDETTEGILVSDPARKSYYVEESKLHRSLPQIHQQLNLQYYRQKGESILHHHLSHLLYSYSQFIPSSFRMFQYTIAYMCFPYNVSILASTVDPVILPVTPTVSLPVELPSTLFI